MAEAEFQRGVGTGEQLPQGGASAANDALAQVPEAEDLTLTPEVSPDETIDANGVPIGVEWQDDEEPVEPDIQSEEDEILFADPEGLGRDMPDPEAPTGPIPASVVRRLPALRRAAADPSAPASLKAMYRLLAHQLEEEMRG